MKYSLDVPFSTWKKIDDGETTLFLPFGRPFFKVGDHLSLTAYSDDPYDLHIWCVFVRITDIIERRSKKNRDFSKVSVEIELPDLPNY